MEALADARQRPRWGRRLIGGLVLVDLIALGVFFVFFSGSESAPAVVVSPALRDAASVRFPSDGGANTLNRANPGYRLGMPFVYVGMTGLDPDLRFDRHKAGIQANRYVFEFGLRLLPQLYAVYNPMPYDGARDMEVELAIGLREAGYGVWQA